LEVVGSRSNHICNAAQVHSLGAWNWGFNRTGLEIEVIVKEKCKNLIQCQEKQYHNNKAQNISLREP
jgi:hypothetical protein